MKCERRIDVASTASGRDFTATRTCSRDAAWTVTTPDGESLSLCTQHARQLDAYWGGRATTERKSS